MASKPPSRFVREAMRRRRPPVRVPSNLPRKLTDPAYVTPTPYAHLEALGGRKPEQLTAAELESEIRRGPTEQEIALRLAAEGRTPRWYNGVGYRLALRGIERLALHPEEIEVRDPEAFFDVILSEHPELVALEPSWEQKRWAHAAAVRIADAYL